MVVPGYIYIYTYINIFIYIHIYIYVYIYMYALGGCASSLSFSQKGEINYGMVNLRRPPTYKISLIREVVQVSFEM